MPSAGRALTMNSTIHEKHHDNFKMYINDVIGLERDILNAIGGQLEDDRVINRPGLAKVLREIIAHGEVRLAQLKAISEEEGGSVGAAVKEAVMSATGALAGLYGKFREHALSRMLRDDRIAMNVVETSYAMLYTLSLGIGHERAAKLSKEGLNAAAQQVLALTDLLPGLVISELKADAPLVNGNVEDLEKEVLEAIHKAWRA